MEQISAVILSGGLARRLNGVEKGLQVLAGQPLISHILARLAPQVGRVYLNINRSQAQYAQRYPHLSTYSDRLPDFQGPLSGILSGFEQLEEEYLLFVPCDSPFLPDNLLVKLHRALSINQAQIAYAHDGDRPHPAFALIHRSILEPLRTYLAQGERRLLCFFQQQKSVAVDFSEQPQAFQNFNKPEDFCKKRPLLPRLSVPILGITGYSGTGKTTLLEKLIPELNQRQIRVALMKHSHHNVEVDKPGKDSHRLRLAGANPTLIVCEQRWALMAETAQPASFADLVARIDPNSVDLILVEGFKHEPIPKIQLHRKGLAKPLPEQDDFTLATATDYPLERENCLDINNITQIADFIEAYKRAERG
ncbi:bifunctional molybdenum cofactor guanylyltransferase MobA/molybdopterin-guanine dinucleotide biosynthesis adaptor protein MobB [Pasteurellaceae bacterium RH1A]|nr:bifunctional molybdenum cofactor guanylyltransferase MobA/molybdopterin-guanine dinucleotide biosynthesis adaptor protein MobB [Pasteurellaceae bacterium RH1A]